MANTIETARPVRLAPGGRTLSTRARSTISHFHMVCFLLAITVVLYPSDTHAQGCGPGDHFVDTCPAGMDVVDNSGAVVGIDTTLDCVPNVSLVLSGPTTIDRAAGAPHSIATEIVLLNLTGGGVGIWAGQGPSPNSGVTLAQSFGSIVEQGGDPSLADSSFDVFFEVDLGAGMFAYNQTALVLTAVIDRIPPPNEYIHPTGCLPLFDAQVGGTVVANLISARHTLEGLVGFCGNGTIEPNEVCGEPGLSPCSAGSVCRDCQCELAVTLSEFTAVVGAGQITLSWATEAEIQNEGFNVLRSTDPGRPGQVVNRRLIHAGGGPAFGMGYELIDDTVVPHTTYYYLLEHIGTSGVRTLHGADACKLNVDPECKPLAVTTTPEAEIPRRNP